MKKPKVWTPLNEDDFIPNTRRKCFYNKDRLCDNECIAYNDWEFADKISCLSMNRVIKRNIVDLKEEED